MEAMINDVIGDVAANDRILYRVIAITPDRWIEKSPLSDQTLTISMEFNIYGAGVLLPRLS